MRQTLQEQRKKNRERTARHRAKQKKAGRPDARQVDRAMNSALVHLVIREKMTIDKRGMVRLMELALKVLVRRFDKSASREAIEKQMSAIKKENLIGMLLRREEIDRQRDIA